MREQQVRDNNMSKLYFQTLYFTFVKCLIPIIQFIGKIHLPFTSKEKLMSDYYEIESLLQHGDVILSTSYGHLSNLVNPSKWKHALMYIGKENNIPYIIEAVGEGVVKKSLAQWLSSKDEICILRFNEEILSPIQKIEMVNWIKKQLGKPYDYSFDSQTQDKFKNFYCSELVYYAIKSANPKAQIELRDTNGILTITPSDYYNMIGKKNYLVYEFQKGKEKEILK
jgi:uncharacterized protein YycO